MRIGIFTNNYLPNPYGVSASIEGFRKEFEALGHQVFIFAPKWKGYQDKNSNACPSGRRVFRYPSIDIEIKFRFPLPIPYSRRMDKIIENLDLDIIHSQHPNLLGSAAMKWAKKKNIPLVFTWHTLYDKYANFAPFLPEKAAAWWTIRNAKNYANKCGQVIIPTESLRPIIQRWGVTNGKITAIATGVDEENFQNPERDLIRKKHQIADDEVLLVLISRLTEEKNIDFLFESVIPILKNNVKVKFLVAGDGYLVPELKNLMRQAGLEQQVIFSGIVGRTELKNYFSAGDIFVYASKSETQGMVITEAMYCGLPIVALNATGVSSLVENGVNGLLVSENKSEFTEAVNKLINDIELRKKMSANSARIAKEKYTAQICAQKMLEIYNKAINNKKI